MKRIILGLTVVAALATFAAPAFAATGYSVNITSPSGTVQGTVTINASVSGANSSQVDNAAYVIGSWSEANKVSMSGSSGGPFSASWDTEGLANGNYSIEVRVWSGTPAYNPNDSSTYSSDTQSVAVSNPPPAPTGLSGTTQIRQVSINWDPVETSDRSDFAGYDVYQKSGDCAEGLSGFSNVASGIEASSYDDGNIEPGTYCFKVTANRSSPSGGSISSSPSQGLRLVVQAPQASPEPGGGGGPGGSGPGGSGPGGGGPGGTPGSGPGAGPSGGGGFSRFTVGGGPAPGAPSIPGITGGEIDWGTYRQRLPYQSQTITQAAGLEEQAQGILGDEATNARSQLMAVAAGMVLALSALLIRRFLAVTV